MRNLADRLSCDEMSEFRISARRWPAMMNWHGKSFKSALRSWL
jgi:hypothetical protein